MSKQREHEHDDPAAAAVEHATSQDAPAAPSEQAVTPPASPSPAPPQPLYLSTDAKVAKIVAVIRDISWQLTLPQRTQIIEALNVHLQPKPTPPSPYDGRRDYQFRVSWSKEVAEVVAKTDREAWAIACDGWKSWPSPKAGKVECLGEVAAPPA